MNKILDISMRISNDMPVYKGKIPKRPVLKTDSDFSHGTVYESRLDINMHTGTHIDMPLHIFEGRETINTLALEKVVTRCKVVDLTDINECISNDRLIEKNITRDDFILLKTKNSYQDILEGDFIYLDKSGAEYLRSVGIKGIGIDSLGIERNQPDHGTHKILLGAGIVILEGLRLKDVEKGEYILVAAPLNVAGAEAAPVRAILISEE